MKEGSNFLPEPKPLTKLTYTVHVCIYIYIPEFKKQDVQDHVITREPRLPQDKAAGRGASPEFRRDS